MAHSHSIYVVGSDQKVNCWHQEIFEKIVQHISKGYAVAYVGDIDESAAIRRFLDKKLLVEEYIQKGVLTLVNRDTFYSPFVPSGILLKQWNKLFASMEKKVGKGSFKGFVAIGMPADSFFLSELDNQQLVQYESLAATHYDGSLDAMCIYTNEMIQKMPLKYIISLLNAHQNTGHRGGTLKAWSTNRGLAVIKRGFDSALGPSVTEMVLQILVRDFEMDEDAVVLHPDQFERKLEILLGPSAAALVISHIRTELHKDLAY